MTMHLETKMQAHRQCGWEDQLGGFPNPGHRGGITPSRVKVVWSLRESQGDEQTGTADAKAVEPEEEALCLRSDPHL